MPKQKQPRTSLPLEEVELDFYVVINSDNQYLRSKGYSGYGDKWVDDIRSAKVYGKIGPARSQVTFFAKNYPKYPTPKIAHFKAKLFEVVDETKLVNKKLAQAEARAKKEKAQEAKHELELAKKRLTEANLNLLKAEQKISKIK